MMSVSLKFTLTPRMKYCLATKKELNTGMYSKDACTQKPLHQMKSLVTNNTMLCGSVSVICRKNKCLERDDRPRLISAEAEVERIM